MLFDLDEDPQELNDLGADARYADIIDRLYRHLQEWSLRMAQRVTMSEEAIDKKRGEPQREGILVGVHQATDLPEDFTAKYTGPARQIHFERKADRLRFGGPEEAAE